MIVTMRGWDACDEDVEAWVLGMLSARERVAMEDHVAGCASCAETAEEVRTLVDALSQVHGRVRSPALEERILASAFSRRSRRLTSFAPYAAALAAGLLIGVALGWKPTRAAGGPIEDVSRTPGVAKDEEQPPLRAPSTDQGDTVFAILAYDSSARVEDLLAPGTVQGRDAPSEIQVEEALAVDRPPERVAETARGLGMRTMAELMVEAANRALVQVSDTVGVSINF